MHFIVEDILVLGQWFIIQLVNEFREWSVDWHWIMLSAKFHLKKNYNNGDIHDRYGTLHMTDMVSITFQHIQWMVV